jgi:hypothetical protein
MPTTATKERHDIGIRFVPTAKTVSGNSVIGVIDTGVHGLSSPVVNSVCAIWATIIDNGTTATVLVSGGGAHPIGSIVSARDENGYSTERVETLLRLAAAGPDETVPANKEEFINWLNRD